jgi:hypothetical protein
MTSPPPEYIVEDMRLDRRISQRDYIHRPWVVHEPEVVTMQPMIILGDNLEHVATRFYRYRVDEGVGVAPLDGNDFHRCNLSTAYPHHGTNGRSTHHHDQVASATPHTLVAMNIQKLTNQIAFVMAYSALDSLMGTS